MSSLPVPKVTKEIDQFDDDQFAEKLIQSSLPEEYRQHTAQKKKEPKKEENLSYTILEQEKEEYELELANDLPFEMEDVLQGKVKLTEIQISAFVQRLKRSWPNFSEVFMISGLTGKGTEVLKQYFIDKAIKAPWNFNENVGLI